jgi:hypothetical protein
MFIQVFQGQLADPELWRRQSQTWLTEIRPMARGFLGFTSGITSSGYAVTVARFESEAQARADSDLPEQGAWFEQTAKAFDGDVIFHDCVEVDVMLAGGSDQAGFVQVMQGRAKDQQAMRASDQAMEAELRRIRPDLIGGIVGWHGDGGGFTQVSYFTSESEARRNEKAMADSTLMTQFQSMLDGVPTFYDFTEVAFA